jgi:hypothetical protein
MCQTRYESPIEKVSNIVQLKNVEINEFKKDSIFNSIKKTYANYEDDAEISDIFSVNTELLKKQATNINKYYKQKRKHRKKNSQEVAIDTLLDLTPMIGEKLEMVIDSVYTDVTIGFTFFGYLDKCKGTTWAIFTIGNNGKVTGQITGFNNRIINFKTFYDSLIVRVKFPFSNPGEKYISKAKRKKMYEDSNSSD